MMTDADDDAGPWTPFTATERAMARRMDRAAEVPIAHQYVMVDMTDALAVLDRMRIDGWEASVNLVVLAATVVGLRAVPDLAHEVDLANLRRRVPATTNVGIAVSSPRGLVVPVVRNALALDFTELAHRYRATVAAARAGERSPEQFRDGHFTVTNLGRDGVDGGIPIPNVPQIAIMGVSTIREVPAVVRGSICVRRVARVGVSLDHRALDGATVARFLRTVRSSLETFPADWPELSPYHRSAIELDGDAVDDPQDEVRGRYRLDGVALSPEGEKVLQDSLVRFPQPPNLFGLLAHVPAIGSRLASLGDRLVFKSSLSPRSREVVILRVARQSHCAYELAQHRRIARDCGLTESEVHALTTLDDARSLTAVESLSAGEISAGEVADEVSAPRCRVSDPTWDRASAEFTPQQLIEIVTLAGYYRMLAAVANSVNLPLDDEPIPFRVDADAERQLASRDTR